MSSFEFILPSTSKAIAGNEEALHLLEQKQRVEHSVATNDPALMLDTSKALLETTYKTILNDRGEAFNTSDNMNMLYGKVKNILMYSRNVEAKKMLEKLIDPIAQLVPQLRNKFGASSHGKDGYFLSPIEMPEAEMVVHLVDGMAGFLLTKSRILATPENSERIYYEDYEEFNEDLDTLYGPFDLKIEGSKPIPYSKCLFDYDTPAYKEGLIQFLNQKKEEEEEEAQPIIEITTQSDLTELVSAVENQQELD